MRRAGLRLSCRQCSAVRERGYLSCGGTEGSSAFGEAWGYVRWRRESVELVFFERIIYKYRDIIK